MSSSFQSGGDDHFQFQNLSFTHKLFDILSDERNRDIIAWNKGEFALLAMNLPLILLDAARIDGDNFEVLDPKSLEKDILPRYFRHSRFQSLVRQLNFYSFKVSQNLYWTRSIFLLFFYRKWARSGAHGYILTSSLNEVNQSCFHRSKGRQTSEEWCTAPIHQQPAHL